LVRPAHAKPGRASCQASGQPGKGLQRQAKRPLILTGNGILWSEAAAALQAFDLTGIPFYTTP